MQVTIDYGGQRSTLEIEPDRLVALKRGADPRPLADPAKALRDALEAPRRFPPLRRALTPDDRVVVVVDDALPRAGELLAVVLDHISSAGVAPESVTLVSPPGSPQAWIDDLPDEFADAQLELHDPSDRKRLAYLATTKAGQRIYLNRTVVEADQLVLLVAPHYAANADGAGPGALIFPTFGDGESRQTWASRAAPGDADEILWMLGSPFVVQVVPASQGGAAEVIAGSLDTLTDGRTSLVKYWQGTADAADVVIAAVTGTADEAAVARAAAVAATVVRPQGHVVVLGDGPFDLGEGFQRMLATDDAADAIAALRKSPPADWPSASAWLHAVRDTRVMLLSGLPAETAEGLFATPLDDFRQVQRLLDRGGSCLILPDAQRLLVTPVE